MEFLNLGFVINIVLIVLVFSIIVIIHELGHFLVAKANKIAVREFSVGMGPSIFHITKGETKYSLRLLPFGGYCMMEGEDAPEETNEKAYLSKSVWQRIAVVLAGPVANFVLAFVLAIVLIGIVGYNTSKIEYIVEGSAAEQAGLQLEDEILSIGNERVYNFGEVYFYMHMHQDGNEIPMNIQRNGEKIQLTVTPVLNHETGMYQIGISGGYTREKGNVISTLKYSALEIRYWIKTTVMSLKMLVTGKAGVKDLSGPVGMANVMNDTLTEAKEAGGAIDVFLNILNYCILISANLGVMNLLPIPAIDGGKLVFLFVEAITGKKVPPEKEAMVHFIGFALLFLLMAVVMFNDIKNVFF